jgi:hypothetical protein
MALPAYTFLPPSLALGLCGAWIWQKKIKIIRLLVVPPSLFVKTTLRHYCLTFLWFLCPFHKTAFLFSLHFFLYRINLLSFNVSFFIVVRWKLAPWKIKPLFLITCWIWFVHKYFNILTCFSVVLCGIWLRDACSPVACFFQVNIWHAWSGSNCFLKFFFFV